MTDGPLVIPDLLVDGRMPATDPVPPQVRVLVSTDFDGVEYRAIGDDDAWIRVAPGGHVVDPDAEGES